MFYDVFSRIGRSRRSLGKVWERSQGGFPRGLVVFRRFWEVSKGSAGAWDAFMKYHKGFTRFEQDFRRV